MRRVSVVALDRGPHAERLPLTTTSLQVGINEAGGSGGAKPSVVIVRPWDDQGQDVEVLPDMALVGIDAAVQGQLKIMQDGEYAIAGLRLLAGATLRAASARVTVDSCRFGAPLTLGSSSGSSLLDVYRCVSNVPIVAARGGWEHRLWSCEIEVDGWAHTPGIICLGANDVATWGMGTRVRGGVYASMREWLLDCVHEPAPTADVPMVNTPLGCITVLGPRYECHSVDDGRYTHEGEGKLILMGQKSGVRAAPTLTVEQR